MLKPSTSNNYHTFTITVEIGGAEPRPVGGIDLLGGAAATEHDVATFVTTAPARITAKGEKRIDKSGFYVDNANSKLHSPRPTTRTKVG